LDSLGNTSIITAQIDGGSTDNCTVNTISLNANSFDCSHIGTNSVTLTITDDRGNSSTCVSTVTIEDNETPTITDCPPNIAVSNDPGNCEAVVTWVIPSTSDNCNTSLISTNNSGEAFTAEATTTISYTSIDPAGNFATCEFQVVVSDDEAPIINGCLPDLQVCGSVAFWSPPIGNDNCNLSSLTRDQTNGSFFNPNVTTITYTALDDAGNSSLCEFDVTVNSIPSADAGPDVNITNGDSVILGGSPVATGGTPPYTYQWYDLSAVPVALFSTNENPLVSPNASNLYSLFVIDSNGCAGTANVSVVVNLIGDFDQSSKDEIVWPQSLESQFTVFPNPTGGVVHLDMVSLEKGEREFLVEIFNALGQLMMKYEGCTSEGSQNKIQLNHLADGHYLIKMSSENAVHTQVLFLKK
jgi:hypothetical protein